MSSSTEPGPPAVIDEAVPQDNSQQGESKGNDVVETRAETEDAEEENDPETAVSRDDPQQGESKGNLSSQIALLEMHLYSQSEVDRLDNDLQTERYICHEHDIDIAAPASERNDNVLHFMAGKGLVSTFLTRAVLDSDYPDVDLQRILGQKRHDLRNGIHLAIKNGLDPQLTIDLIRKTSDSILSDQDREGYTPLHHAVEYERCNAAQLDVVMALLEEGDSALDVKTIFETSVYRQNLLTRPRNAEDSILEDERVALDIAHSISMDVKLQYLRSTFKCDRVGKQRTHNTALDFLYVAQEGKDVEKIIKVVVNDPKKPFHKEQAMIEALKPFSIEILDWSRPDLPTSTIVDSCKYVRELHLGWVLSDKILTPWSGKDGLAQLPNLIDVFLRHARDPKEEQPQQINKELVIFEKRLKIARDVVDAAQKKNLDCFPEIAVHRSEARTEPDKRHIEQKRDTIVMDHQWLKIMDHFASGIFSIHPGHTIKCLPSALERDVRICLIDNGVDAEHKSISERIDANAGRSLGIYPEEEEYRAMTPPFYDSTTNHGTLMANMIVRVCPFAKIVSYRLDTRPGEDDRLHFTAKSAADALEHAVEQNFDIICMSWTVKHENNSKDIARLIRALREAVKTKIVFCSSPDVGDISFEKLSCYYPIGSHIQDLFQIGAATADRLKQYCGAHFPGPRRPREERNEVIQKDKSFNSPSSIATTLAAGLAALLIHVLRVAIIRTYELKNQDSKDANIIKLNYLDTIKSPRMMRKVFDRMCLRGGKMYVDVWGNFDKKGKELKTAKGGGEIPTVTSWKIVEELARDIVLSSDLEQIVRWRLGLTEEKSIWGGLALE
ncbi:hypothetical protein QBC38DRAFT_550635 [Podospora fimiseda]|uniref:Peptidase S8/S53 domain-containing protein n=1 Tax=Podospora fimiseda TaxID=252190 RepID=A0AAN6YLC2_9PEZI|nr:hypothetical protein QBC38DRAFT_550635 [Podospora fimiseda]